MRCATISFFLLVVASFWVSSVRAAEADPNQLTDDEKKAGFELLFNSRDFDGWQQPGNWKIDDGALMRRGRGGEIACKKYCIHGDYELRFEYRASKQESFVGDDGAFGFDDRTIPLTEIFNGKSRVFDQIEVLSRYATAAGEIKLSNEPVRAGEHTASSSPCHSCFMTPSKSAAHPIGQWNSGRIVWRGNVVEHWLNGEMVFRLDFANDKEIEGTGMKAVLAQREIVKKHGVFLHLDDGEHPAWFRGIKVRAATLEKRTTESGESNATSSTPVAGSSWSSSPSAVSPSSSTPSAGSSWSSAPSGTAVPTVRPLNPETLGKNDMVYTTSCEGLWAATLSIEASPPLNPAVTTTWSKIPGTIDLTLDYPCVKEGEKTALDLLPLAELKNLRLLIVGKPGFFGSVEGPAKGEGFASFKEDLRCLAGNAQLTHLRIRRCVISSEAAENIASIPNLTSLSLMYCDMKGDALAALAKSKSLRRLDVTACEADDASVRRLANCPKLEHLVLVNTPITEEAFSPWGGEPPLKILDISGTKVAGDKLNRLRQFRKLETLYAAGLTVVPEQIQALAESCPLKTVTLTLAPRFGDLCKTLAGRGIQVQDGRPAKRTVEHPFSFTPEAVKAKPHSFLQLNFTLDVPTTQQWKDWTAQQREGFERLRGDWTACTITMYNLRNDETRALNCFKNMHSLRLNQFNMFGESMSEGDSLFAREFRKEMAWCRGQYAELFRTWQSSSSLEELELEDCPLNAEAVACLGKIPSLRALNLKKTGVDDSVGAALAKFPKLERLRLQGRQITDRAVRDLATSRSIQFLDLSKTSVTDACVESLLKMPALKEVHFHETKVSEAAGKRLAERKITVLHKPDEPEHAVGSCYMVQPDRWKQFNPPCEYWAVGHIE